MHMYMAGGYGCMSERGGLHIPGTQLQIVLAVRSVIGNSCSQF